MITSPFSDSEVREIRSLFQHTNNGITYLNHAAISPIPLPVKSAVSKWIDIRAEGPVENFEELEQTIHQTREQICRYINASDPGQITFLGNTSDAISAVAGGLDWSGGDEILLNTMEFPANVHPFRRLESKGVKLRYIPHQNHTITTKQIQSYITPQTRMVSISAVQYLSGYRADLEAIGNLCKKNNLLFVVDGIQALGAAPIDVQKCHIDALGTGAHKWLMSPMGIGFLFLSENLQEKLTPVKTGWLSVENPWDLSEFNQPWLPVSSHLETGTPNIIGISGLYAALQLFEYFDEDLIEKQISYLSTYICTRLETIKNADIQLITKKDDCSRLGIVSFSLPGNAEPAAVVEEMKKKNIIVSARENYFRFSPHFYNTEQEIDKAIDSLFTFV